MRLKSSLKREAEAEGSEQAKGKIPKYNNRYFVSNFDTQIENKFNMRAQEIGIDKLILTGIDYSVEDASSEHLALKRDKRQGCKEDVLPKLLTDERGKEVRAWAMYHNSSRLQMNIDDRGLNVIFNPDKIISPYYPKLTEINSAGYNEAISLVDKELRKIGVKVNVEQMKINRIDLAKQSTMNYPVFQYADAFKLFASKRKMKKRNYLETHTIGNTQHQVCFYDKKQELIAEGLSNYVQDENNLMRAEIRLLKSKATQKILSCSTLADARKLQPADISEIYSGYMNKNLFNKPAAEQMIFNFNEQVELLMYLKKHYKNRAVSKYLMMLNLDEYLLTIGGIDIFLKLFAEAGYSRNSIYRIRKDIEELLSIKGRVDTLLNKVSTAILIDELKLKFAA